MYSAAKPTMLEFFAGGGLAGLSASGTFDTIWANDFDATKAATYVENFGPEHFVLADIHDIEPDTVPTADLAWASFPCQDLSLAGDRGGLNASRSSAFYGFMRVIAQMHTTRVAPKIIVLENVSGLLTSRGGADFTAVINCLAGLGYKAGALEIDARLFVAQSRLRVFIVAVRDNLPIPPALQCSGTSPFLTPAIAKAQRALPWALAAQTINWHLPQPATSPASLDDAFDSTDQNWWAEARTLGLIERLSPRHLATLNELQRADIAKLGTIYRRTRTRNGVKSAIAELRHDGIAGCLRTPSGGSSRQFWLLVEGEKVRARSMNAREAMRLMGVPDTYKLPKSQLAGLKIAGDGVAVPVVAWLTRELLGKLVFIT